MREAKAEFRRMLKTLPEQECSVADQEITARVLALPAYQEARCVLVYLSIGYEVNTEQIIEDALKHGKKLCVPRCHTGGLMDAVEISGVQDLQPGMYHIPEPRDSLAPIDPCELDLIVVPGMAFDRSRNRLGRGAGYYDRFLERADRAVTVGICRNARLFDAVPCAPHDRPMDLLITEQEIIQKDDA